MDRDEWIDEQTVLPGWRRAMESAARALELPFHPVLVRGWMEGHEFLACVRKLGGQVRPCPGFDGWVLALHDDDRLESLRAVIPDYFVDTVGVGDFHGMLELSLGDERFLVLRTEQILVDCLVRAALILGGPSLEATLRLAARVKAVYAEIFRTKRVRVYGSRLAVPEEQSVAESELILPAAFKTPLLAYLDGFWRAAKICATLRLTPSRGVLFVGAPGTGKTQTIRHLLGRYPECSFSVFTPPPPGGKPPETFFERMLGEIAIDGRPAVVVIEDIDRLFDDGGMTPQVFLNAVDGLFQSKQPVLWIATSNDPTGLAPNILDRPGRFDRIFVFELPGVEERLTLLKRFSPWPANPEVLERVARDAAGLSGAHIRELCVAAALASAEAPEAYGASLVPELHRIQEQHQRAQRYDFGMSTPRPVGFESYLSVAKEAGSGRPERHTPVRCWDPEEG
jgi:hypothetical protein